MKRTFKLLLVAVLVAALTLAMTGCCCTAPLEVFNAKQESVAGNTVGNNAFESATTTTYNYYAEDEDEPSQNDMPAMASLGDSVTTEKLTITAEEMKISSGYSIFTPAEGYEYVGVKFTIRNDSIETVTISSMLMFNAYIDDVKYGHSVFGASAISQGESTLNGNVDPDCELVGWFVAEVPTGWNEMEIEIKPDWLSDATVSFVMYN